MNLKEKITADLKEAMKSKDKLRLETVRSIRALILEFEKSGANKELTEDDEIRILQSAVKSRKESYEMYLKAGREDLATKEENEIKIVSEYLPKQLTEEEIFLEVKHLAEEIGAKAKSDFPKLMPAAMKRLKGKADGNFVRQAVEKLLG
ncbi:MAG: GatB/YqeY domain-containing protein [Ignavibacteriales bacterium]|nr:GatB/YqeY domain-containing protein [Ignavibacteriales bacterium]